MWALSRPGADSSRRGGRRGPAAGEAGSAAARGRSRCRWRGGRRWPRLPHARPEDGGVSPGREARNQCGRGGQTPAAPAGAGGSGGFFRVLPCAFSRSRSVYFSRPRMEARTTGFAEFPFPRAPRGASCLKGQALHLDQKQHGPFQFFQARVWCKGRVSEPGPRVVNPLGQGCAPWQRGGCHQSLPSAALAHPHFQLELICPSGSCSGCHCGALLELSPRVLPLNSHGSLVTLLYSIPDPLYQTAFVVSRALRGP